MQAQMMVEQVRLQMPFKTVRKAQFGRRFAINRHAARMRNDRIRFREFSAERVAFMAMLTGGHRIERPTAEWSGKDVDHSDLQRRRHRALVVAESLLLDGRFART